MSERAGEKEVIRNLFEKKDKTEERLKEMKGLIKWTSRF